MDRLKRESNPPVGQLASPIPQYKRPGSTDYEAVEGQHGAPFAILKDASGNVVSPATEAKLEQVRALLSGVATEAKLEQARTLLNTISNKDFATQATLEVVQSELALIKSELEAIKANQISGDQRVQLSGTIGLELNRYLAQGSQTSPDGERLWVNILDTSEDLVVEGLEWFSDRPDNYLRITAKKNDRGFLYLAESTARNVFRPSWMKFGGFMFWDVVQYDETNNKYRFRWNGPKFFPGGIKIERGTESTTSTLNTAVVTVRYV